MVVGEVKFYNVKLNFNLKGLYCLIWYFVCIYFIIFVSCFYVCIDVVENGNEWYIGSVFE